MKRTVAVLLGFAIAASATAASAAPPARSVKEENALYSFEYSYPAQAGAIPGLRVSLDADLATRLATLKRDAREGQAEARQNDYPYNPYAWNQSWQVVTDLPGWLSLSASYWTYTGGAHGMGWSGAMLWDRKANRARNPLNLFISKAALAKAIRQPFCAALDRQRSEKRGEPVNRASGDQFDACIDPTEQTVILGSRSKKGFDRIGILVAPYSAGPYVEGSYEVTVPVTAAVLNAVKPAFRANFAIGK